MNEEEEEEEALNVKCNDWYELLAERLRNLSVGE